MSAELLPPPPAPPPAAHVAVADALRRRIALGGFVAGDRLPSERELAGMLGVGRATLRRALRALAADGLVETTLGRNGGTFVRGAPALERAQRGRLAHDLRAQVRDSFELRRAVEPAAARLCALRAPARRRAAIAVLVHEAAPSMESYHGLDSRLHLEVAAGSGNPLLYEVVARTRAEFFVSANALWMNVDWGRLRGSGAPVGEAFAADHARIAEAIARADGDGAQAAMARHLQVAERQFGALLDALADGR